MIINPSDWDNDDTDDPEQWENEYWEDGEDIDTCPWCGSTTCSALDVNGQLICRGTGRFIP